MVETRTMHEISTKQAASEELFVARFTMVFCLAYTSTLMSVTMLL
jgi:hypothetical protein